MSTTRDQLVELDRVANLLGKPPGWMLFWGNGLVALLLLTLLGLASLIQYPDEVQASVRLTTEPAPVRQLMPVDGIIADLLFPEHRSVEAGEVLAVLESTAEWSGIQQLADLLDTLNSLSSPVDVLGLRCEEQLEIGRLRPAYARLLNELMELQYWLKRSNQGERAANLQRQLRQNTDLARQLRQQLQTATSEYQLAEANYLRFDSLLARGAASQMEVDQAQAQALQAKFRLEGQQGRALELKLNREGLHLDKLRIAEQLSDEVTTRWLGFKRELRNLQSAYYNWREAHLLEAPISGVLSLLSELRVGQQVAATTPLWGIVPTDTRLQWVAVGTVGDAALGKIGLGDTALIRLPAFPHREYGQLAARVADLSLLPETTDGQPRYRLELTLTQGLLTSYQRQLELRQSLSGQAYIISEKRSLLARIFDRLWQIKDRLNPS